MKQRRRRGLLRRRHREGKTNYPKRMKLITSGLPRLVIRRSLKNITAQLIQYTPTGDKVLAASTTQELEKKYGWKAAKRNTPAAYLTGYLLGKKAQKQNIKKAVADTG